MPAPTPTVKTLGGSMGKLADSSSASDRPAKRLGYL
jgi:hypothetical protein